MVIFRRSLRGRYTSAERPVVPHRPLLVVAMVVCGAVGPLLLLGVNVLVVAASAALALVVGCLIGYRSLLSWRLLPWQLVLGVSVLFVLVQVAHDHGLAAVLSRAAGHGDGLPALLRLAGLAALGANAIDNLPSYLALEPAATSPLRLAALLIGVNAGPLVSPWASLATLLWASRCRAAGLSVDWFRFAVLGAVVVVPLLAGSVAALELIG
jgi:arsenical pump membrane protein